MNFFAKSLAVAATALAVGSASAEYATIYWTVDPGVETSFAYDYAGVAYKAPAESAYSAYLLDGSDGAGMASGTADELFVTPADAGKSVPGALPMQDAVDYGAYAFRIELFSGDDTLIAVSEAATFASLQNVWACVGKGTDEPGGGTWSPTAYHAVPEPTGGLLVLLGLAGLALKRKRA